MAIALGCLFFLFELFVGLTSSGGNGLSEEMSSLGPSFEVPSGASLTTMLAAITCIALGAGALLVLWRWLKDRPGTPRWVIVCGGAPAVAILGLGTYLLVSGRMHGSLPYGSVPYMNYDVNIGGMEPLELIVLATIVLAVMLVGVTKPRLLILLLALCLVAVLLIWLFSSCAIRGPNLFDHPSQLQPAAGYTEQVNALRQGGPATVPSSQELDHGRGRTPSEEIQRNGDSQSGEAAGTEGLSSRTHPALHPSMTVRRSQPRPSGKLQQKDPRRSSWKSTEKGLPRWECPTA